MKDKNKTVALTLLALILYALFVWHGMTYDPLRDSLISIPVGSLLNINPSQPSGGTSAVSTTTSSQSAQKNYSYARSSDGWYQFSKIKWRITSYAIHNEGGRKYLLYGFTWENTSDKPISFMEAMVDLEAYQHGVQCKEGIVIDFDTNETTKVKSGIETKSYRAIELTDKSTVETYISEYFSNINPVNFNVDVGSMK